MNKLHKLKTCDWVLLIVTVTMLASGIQLEIISGQSVLWIWIHIIIGVLFFVFTGWHLYLHFRWRNWFKTLWLRKCAPIKWLTATALLSLLSGLIASAGWVASPEHSVVGAIHGKIGFLLMIFAIGHIIKRRKIYRNTISADGNRRQRL